MGGIGSFALNNVSEMNPAVPQKALIHRLCLDRSANSVGDSQDDFRFACGVKTSMNTRPYTFNGKIREIKHNYA